MGRAIDDVIADYLATERTIEDFYDDWIWYSKFGHVVSFPNFFCMCRPVAKDAVVDGTFERTTFEQPDTWYLYEYAGADGLDGFARFWDIAPVELPFAAWHRKDGELRIFPNSRLKGIIHGRNTRYPESNIPNRSSLVVGHRAREARSSRH